MTLYELLERYFSLMRSRPTLADLARFTVEIPSHLQLAFLGWLRARADQLEAELPLQDDELLN